MSEFWILKHRLKGLSSVGEQSKINSVQGKYRNTVKYVPWLLGMMLSEFEELDKFNLFSYQEHQQGQS